MIARVAFAMWLVAATANAEPCRDLASYDQALSAHRRFVIAKCQGVDSDECANEAAAIENLRVKKLACLDGEDVGPAGEHAVAAPVVPPSEPPLVTGYIELQIGGALPIADGDARRGLGASPLAGVRAGAAIGDIGALVSVDLVDDRLEADTFTPPQAGNRSMSRLRFLGHLFFQHAVTEDLVVSVRAGIGVDLASLEYQVADIHENEDDSSISVEIGGAAWWKLDDTFEIGGGLELQDTAHQFNVNSGDVTFAELALVIGARIRS